MVTFLCNHRDGDSITTNRSTGMVEPMLEKTFEEFQEKSLMLQIRENNGGLQSKKGK